MTSPANDVDLTAEWPDFLGMLDQDPEEATERFARFTRHLMSRRPPRNLRKLSKHPDADAMVSYFIEDCWAHSFRRLRAYKPHGKPFAAFLFVCASNYFTDVLRKWLPEPAITPTSSSEPDGTDPVDRLIDPLPDPLRRLIDHEEEARRRRLIQLIQKCISRMALDDQVIINAHLVDGFKPREIARFVPRYDNKQIGNKLAYLRRQLVSCVTRECEKTPIPNAAREWSLS